MRLKIFVTSYVILILVMFVLPFFSEENYSILRNTTSQLGAQKTTNAWIMNITFAMMGLASIYAGWQHYQVYWFHKIMLLLFGLSLVFAGIFSHAPLDKDLVFSIREDEIHSIFASLTGFGFTVLAISTAFIKRDKSQMILPIAIGLLATLLSLMMFSIEAYAGIWQRLIFICSFGWMIYEFKSCTKVAN